jgi:hypothetical protein
MHGARERGPGRSRLILVGCTPDCYTIATRSAGSWRKALEVCGLPGEVENPSLVPTCSPLCVPKMQVREVEIPIRHLRYLSEQLGRLISFAVSRRNMIGLMPD